MPATVKSTFCNHQFEAGGVSYTLPWNEVVTLPDEAIPALIGLRGVELVDDPAPSPTPAAADEPAPQEEE